MHKRGQIALFLLVGFVIVILLGILVYIRGTDRESSSMPEQGLSGMADVSATMKSVKTYTEGCMKSTLEEGMLEVGFEDTEALEAYIDAHAEECINYSAFEPVRIYKGNFSSNISLAKDNQSLSLVAYFPLTVDNGKAQGSISEFKVNYPLRTETRLEASAQKSVFSQNLVARLSVPQGVTAIGPGGSQVESISITIKDRKKYITPYEEITGMLIYSLEPHGVLFSDSIELSIRYEDHALPPGFDESKLHISYYIDHENGSWIQFMDCDVDEENNILYANITHFTGTAPTYDGKNQTNQANQTNKTNQTNQSGVCNPNPSSQGGRNVFTNSSCCLIDWNTGGPCQSGYVNCDCYSGCATHGSDFSACLVLMNRGSCQPGSGGSKGNELECGNGFLWKPVSESDGNLVILLPSSYHECCEVSVYPYPYTNSSTLIETGDFKSRANGDRPHYRFEHPGSYYCDGGPCSAVVTCGGITDIYHIPDTSERCE